jgi:hypothetical protein
MNKRMSFFILLAVLILISTPLWAQKPSGVTSTGPALQPSVSLHSIRAINAAGVTALATRVHSDARLQVQQKLSLSQAVMQQKNLLATHPDVKEVVQLPGDNLFVRFKDNNELVMLMGADRRGTGGTAPALIQLAQSTTKQTQTFQTTSPKVSIQPPRPFALPSIPGNGLAMVFDALADDGNADHPTNEGTSVATSLKSLGYLIYTRANDDANLDAASKMNVIHGYGPPGYGVIFISSHGGVLNGNDFMFLVRPWYANYPPVSQFAGTVRSSAFSMKHNKIMFAYAITGVFAKTYWKNKFPSTQFFLDTCHGTDPAGRPGMATYVLNNGASSWVGWNSPVNFICANWETKEYFSRMAQGYTIGETIYYINNKYHGYQFPALTLVPATQSQCRLGKWSWYGGSSPPQDVPTGDRLLNVQVYSDGGMLYVRVGFWTAHNVDNGFQIDVDAVGGNGAKIRIICHLEEFQVYRKSASGVYDTFLLRGVPYKMSGYLVGIPWNETLGNATAANLSVLTAVDSPKHDRLPASGSIWLHR